ncbi:MAG: putative Na+/H+ antiporter [Verrucomicrobia bacterium]|nr:putative Na+/H+ antiporter [Verrucomicrobiota bacterium]
MMRTVSLLLLILSLSGVGLASVVAAAPSDATHSQIEFPKFLEEYHDGETTNLWQKLAGRVRVDPFNVVGTIIFLCAILHTFLTSRFMHISHRYQQEFEALADREKESRQSVERQRDALQFRAQFFHFMGEVEAVFGIWLVPLFSLIVLMKGWPTLVAYITSLNPAEPVFVVVIMAMASSRPILRLTENWLAKAAALGGSTPGSWWFSLLTLGPLLGSFITEPAAMTICALLLRQKFYALKPSKGLSYATLGLLFVNISVGGTLTNFAAPPVVLVATKWSWDIHHMLANFGWKAALGIVLANIVYYSRYRSELSQLKRIRADEKDKRRVIPWQITMVHVLFLVWTVFTSHYVSLVVLGFLFFLAFVEATDRHQGVMRLRGPMLVGFFLASLVVHGGFQKWWIAPVLSGLSEWPMMIGGIILTAFNDNAAVTYLASLVPGLAPSLRYAVVAGAVTGGGLTVIANAPNPAGQSILAPSFGEDGVSPGCLFLGAIVPTIIMALAFMLLP